MKLLGAMACLALSVGSVGAADWLEELSKATCKLESPDNWEECVKRKADRRKRVKESEPKWSLECYQGLVEAESKIKDHYNALKVYREKVQDWTKSYRFYLDLAREKEDWVRSISQIGEDDPGYWTAGGFIFRLTFKDINGLLGGEVIRVCAAPVRIAKGMGELFIYYIKDSDGDVFWIANAYYPSFPTIQ